MKPRLAANIKKLRKEKGWAQAELAEKTDSTLSHINKIETGKYNPSMDALIKLSEAFEVTIDQLVFGNATELDEIKLQNKNTAHMAKLIDSLDADDRQTIVGMLKTMLTNKRILSLASKKDILQEEII